MPLFLIGTLLLGCLLGCESKVSVSQTKQDVVNEQKAEGPDSSFSLLDNSTLNSLTGAASAPTCSARNTLRFVLTQKPSRRIFCRDMTAVDKTLTLGPICPGGLEIKTFTSNPNWVACDDAEICGKKVTTKTTLAAQGKSVLTQMDFEQLPWGCSGNIETTFEDQINSTLKPDSVISITVKPPPCPFCSTSNSTTCNICGTDSVVPVIQDVSADVSVCNQVKLIVFASDNESGLHADAYSFDGGTTWQASRQKIYTGTSLNLAVNLIAVRDRAGNITKWTKAVTSTAPPCPCDTPWGERIESGQKRSAYKNATVNCSQNCEPPIDRTCNNGVLSGDTTYKYNSCAIAGCPKCSLPWGEQIDHGIKVTAYAQSNVKCADQCRATTLICERGALVGDAAGYPAKACASELPTCNCQFNGVVLSNGTSKPVYMEAAPACDQACRAGQVTCTLGTLTGDISYKAISCSPTICKCTTAWGKRMVKDEVADAYKSSSVTCAQNIKCDDASNKIQIKCVDATLNKLEVVSGTGLLKDFAQPSCSNPVCSCTHLGTQFKPGDPPITVYKKDKVVAPDRCRIPGNMGQVICTLVSGQFRVSGDTTFGYTSCTETTGGSSDYNVGGGEGGGSGGGIGNDVGEGEGFRRRSRAGGGGGCDPNLPPYYCIGASKRLDTVGTMCFVPTENGYVTKDPASTDLSGRISTGATMGAFKQKIVHCPETCSNNLGLIQCSGGTMSEKTKYPYSDCQEVCP